MKVLSPEDIYEIEKKTIEIQNISSLDLMNIAAKKCFEWIINNLDYKGKHFFIFCGIGNNGGDGLVISKLLLNKTDNIKVFIVNFSSDWKKDFITNYQQLKALNIDIEIINNINEFPKIEDNAIILDCILGAGINRPTKGIIKDVITNINKSDNLKISIDFPSGLMHNKILKSEESAIFSDTTLTFECPKINFFLSENEKVIGKWYVLDIGLDKESIKKVNSRTHYITLNMIKDIYEKRTKYSSKFNYGHSLLIGGSYGKIGAICLASKSAIKSGSGLVTCFAPKCAYEILQTYIPEVMVKTDEDYSFIENISISKSNHYNCIGIGTGMGNNDKTYKSLERFLSENENKLVIDADAINIISNNRHLISMIPKNSVITPHNKEFERLVGKWSNDLEKIKLAEEFSLNYEINLVIKGAHTCITTSNGETYFNSTGNQGMATAGSGDVLTGIITSLISQNYSPSKACIIGVFIHGLSADIAVENNCSFESLSAEDIISNIGFAFKKIY